MNSDMQHRESRSGFSNFTRGSEITWHLIGLFAASVRNALLIGVVVGVLSAVVLGWSSLGSLSREKVGDTYRYYVASAWVAVGMGEARLQGVTDSGIPYETAVVAKQVLAAATRSERTKLGRIALGSALLGGLATLLYVVFVTYFGRKKMTDEHLRGSELMSGEGVRALLERNGDTSPYSIAGVPVRKGAETLHFMFTGASGTGKSQAMFELMDQVRARGKRAIVHDPTGEYTETYFREGRDVILNPLDARSPNWNPWHEVSEDYHMTNIANGLIAEPTRESDPFWATAGRHVLKDVLAVLQRNRRMTNRALYEAISLNTLEDLNALLAGTPGATYTSPTTEKAGMSLKMTIQNQLEPFMFLRDDGPKFSIREWVKDEASDSWLFISTTEAQADAMRPLLSLWTNLVIQSVLDLEPIHRERIWGFLDELTRLQKLPSLEAALTGTRKFGLCLALGIQDFGQLRNLYGADIAQTIISQCQTQLLLRIRDGKAAKALADLMGTQELEKKEESFSYGLNSQRDGVNVHSRRLNREIVMSSEILTLPDMEGYLSTPGPYPVARVKYQYVPRVKVAPGFIKRDRSLVKESQRQFDPFGGLGAAGAAVGGEGIPGKVSDAVNVMIDGDTGEAMRDVDLRSVVRSPLQAAIDRRAPLAGALG
jgi:type IV conjugative transfer system coupling protein TraD